MTVQHRHRAETLDVRQSLLAVIGSPAPVGINGPQRNVCKKDNRSTGRAPVEIVLKPLELVVTERSHPSRFQISNIHQAYEMHSLVIEAVPPRAFCCFPVALEILPAVIGETCIFSGPVVDMFQ